MKEFLTAIGAISLVVLMLYFGVYTPINAFSELKDKNRALVRENIAKDEEIEEVYQNFYEAIRAHTDWETTKAIYEDRNFFPEEEEYNRRKFCNIQSYARLQ